MLARRKIAEFLEGFCEHLDRVGYLNVMNIEKNRKGLLDLGITKKHRETVIRSLTPEDYCEGPILSKKGKGEAWVFGKEFEGREIYIKLQLVETDAPICWSFHVAEYRLDYPMRQPLKKRSPKG